MQNSITRFNKFLANTAKTCIAIMAILLLLSVVNRYFFGGFATWQMEIIKSLNAFAFFAIAGYAYFKNAHVKVDIIYNRLSTRKARYINNLCNFIIIPFLCIAGLYFCFEYVYNALINQEGSREMDGFKYLYFAKISMLLFFITLLLQGLLQGFCQDKINLEK